MTSPTSSTGASSPGRFLRAFALASVLLLALSGMLSWAGLRYGFGATVEIDAFFEQRDRLDAFGPADVVLIGDSSLGAAVDDRYWTASSGQRVLNLGLNGSYGLEGTRNMLRQVLRRFRPDTVVIVQTVDIYKQRPSELGDFYTSFGLPGRTELERLWRVYFNLTTVRESLVGLASLGVGLVRPDRGGGLSADGPKPERMPVAQLDREVEEHPLSPESLVGSFEPLEDIHAICEAAGVACVYVHGPIYDGYCATGARFIEQINADIRAIGLALAADMPLCVPASQIGDASDHVAPEVKLAYTEAIRAQVEATLAREQAPPT